MKSTRQTEEFYQRFLKNQATAAEIDALFEYFEKAHEADLKSMISSSFNNSSKEKIADAERLNHLNALKNKISDRIDNGQTILKLHPKRKKYFNLINFAASFTVIAITGIVIYFFSAKGLSNPESVTPGGNYATLILSDGKEIDLKTNNDGLVANLGGTKIYKSADGKLFYTANTEDSLSQKTNTIVTPRGGQYRITLADGTVVMLNSGSSLTFPVGFHGANRTVKLTGEAYFEVTKNPSKPFIVYTKSISTRVLGTKFNISCYEDDAETKATLLEGKIQVSQVNTEKSAVLKPGEQAVIAQNQFKIDDVNAEDFAAWKDGIFLFSNADLKLIMHHLSRWYNIDIDYNSLPEKRLYIKINKNVNLSEVLRMMSVTSNLKFKLAERRLSVME